MSWSNDGVRYDVDIDGAVTFNDDLTDVESLSPGGWLKIRDRSGLVPRTVEITSTGGTLKHEYFVGGLSRGWNEDGRRFLATMVPILVRRSGMGAESRVKSIFARKGVAGVLEEVDLLGSDYARRLYLETLIDVAHLDSTSVTPVLQRAADNIRSDYDRRQVLQRVASRIRLDQRGVSAYVHTIAAMRSDYDKRESLNALTRSGVSLDGNIAFEALAGMKSSYDKRMVFMEIIERGGSLTTDSKRALLRSVAEPQSDYDRRQVLTAYVKKFGIEPSVRDSFFSAVDSMRSDYDRAETLLVSLSHATVDPATRPAFVASAERLKSSYDQNRVLAALVRSERR